MKIDYSVIPALEAAARRERALEVHRLLIAPIMALFAKQPPMRRTRMLRRSAFG